MSEPRLKIQMYLALKEESRSETLTASNQQTDAPKTKQKPEHPALPELLMDILMGRIARRGGLSFASSRDAGVHSKRTAAL